MLVIYDALISFSWNTGLFSVFGNRSHKLGMLADYKLVFGVMDGIFGLNSSRYLPKMLVKPQVSYKGSGVLDLGPVVIRLVRR